TVDLEPGSSRPARQAVLGDTHRVRDTQLTDRHTAAVACGCSSVMQSRASRRWSSIYRRRVRVDVDSPLAGRRKGAPLSQSAKTMGAGVHALGRGIADSMPVLRPAGPMDHRRCAETRSPRSVARIAGEGLKRVRTDKAGRT